MNTREPKGERIKRRARGEWERCALTADLMHIWRDVRPGFCIAVEDQCTLSTRTAANARLYFFALICLSFYLWIFRKCIKYIEKKESVFQFERFWQFCWDTALPVQDCQCRCRCRCQCRAVRTGDTGDNQCCMICILLRASARHQILRTISSINKTINWLKPTNECISLKQTNTKNWKKRFSVYIFLMSVSDFWNWISIRVRSLCAIEVHTELCPTLSVQCRCCSVSQCCSLSRSYPFAIPLLSVCYPFAIPSPLPFKLEELPEIERVFKKAFIPEGIHANAVSLRWGMRTNTASKKMPNFQRDRNSDANRSEINAKL